jgi:hypothetical protein
MDGCFENGIAASDDVRARRELVPEQNSEPSVGGPVVFHSAFAYYSPMGGERGTTAAKRLAGEICCACKNFLPPPHTRGERYCDKCKPPLKHVYAAFERKKAWQVLFYDSATKHLLRTVTFQDEQKLLELAKRGGALTNLESKQMIENGIDNGKGGVFLKLSQDQYLKLIKR